MRDLVLEKGNALVVVAHPDDETIWMGGTMLMFPLVNWHILSLCRSDDPDRAPKFHKVSKIYSAHDLIMDLEDEGIMNIKESLPEIEVRMREALRYFRVDVYDYLFTHGARGEYGHDRHRGVHHVIKESHRTGELKANNAFTFSYHQQAMNSYCVPDIRRADHRVKLSKELHQRKKDIIHKTYGFRKTIFEYRSCSKVEMFLSMQ